MLSILITGANRGLGLALVKQYSTNLANHIIACCRAPERATKLQEMAKQRSNISVKMLDVCQDKSIEALAQSTQQPIDILFNVAGVIGSSNVDRVPTTQEWLDVLQVNIIGPLKMMNAFLPNIRQGTRKLIINFSSISGSITLIDRIYPHCSYDYSSSKAGLNICTRMFAHQFASEKMTIVALHPGWVKTDMGGPTALLTPEESATSIYKLVNSLSHTHNGKFIDYLGRELPW